MHFSTYYSNKNFKLQHYIRKSIKIYFEVINKIILNRINGNRRKLNLNMIF